ncbi:hypothetical protein TL16_g06575 [Triparma laevis f. inornata]|uniref:DUF5745 domain-containing protein n=1 Tax=Triparma laevis f. inornata TaxID=1714386 RepID=A0A9W7AST5_9STRA|nr:hypothetical protein TL16_g06575 [Triparma laevis f. inornata]
MILANTNALLKSVGVAAKPISRFAELRKSASSMFVAIFEAMFQVRLKGIIRKPSHVKDYEHNAQGVIDALGTSILNMDLSHISGSSIVKGDAHAIMNLVDIFVGISEVWLKRRFQNDALGRTRLGSKGKKKAGKSKGATPVPRLDLPDGPGEEAEEARRKPRPKTAGRRPQSARTASDIHESIAGLASDFPGMWRSLSERGTIRQGDGAEGAAKKPSRLAQAEKRINDQREAKNKADYRRMLKDRLTALKRKDILDAKKQMFRQKGSLHSERVRSIKVKQQTERMRRQQLSFRLKRQNQLEIRMRKLNLSMIKSLHNSKREQELDDAVKIQSLKKEGGARAAALDAFFAERVGMAQTAITVQEEERAETARAQEAAIRELLRELSKDSKARVERQLEKASTAEDQSARDRAEATLALAQVIGVEDWEGVYKDRFMTPMVREVQALTKGMEMGLAGKLSEVKQEKKVQSRKRMLKKAYGSGVGRRR